MKNRNDRFVAWWMLALAGALLLAVLAGRCRAQVVHVANGGE